MGYLLFFVFYKRKCKKTKVVLENVKRCNKDDMITLKIIQHTDSHDWYNQR